MLMQYYVTKQIPLGNNRKLQRVRLHHRVGSRYLHSHASLKWYNLSLYDSTIFLNCIHAHIITILMETIVSS